MFQDIKPHVFDSQYSPRLPGERDYVLVWKNMQVMLIGGGEKRLPFVSDFLEADEGQLVYLFSIDNVAFFLSHKDLSMPPDAGFWDLQTLRTMKPQWMAFGAATAAHLANWYENNKYCGKCAAQMELSQTERALACPKCRQPMFPSISPVVIVGVISGEKLLLIKHVSGYKKYALVAGYVEVGETLEETVKREVLEEVGLKVAKISYYKSQPWAFSQSLLMGFFAEIQGDDKVQIDTAELSEGTWFHRNDIPKGDSTASLTWTMIEAFRSGFSVS